MCGRVRRCNHMGGCADCIVPGHYRSTQPCDVMYDMLSALEVSLEKVSGLLTCSGSQERTGLEVICGAVKLLHIALPCGRAACVVTRGCTKGASARGCAGSWVYFAT
jgi:hypothetical protein